jgi:NAD+ diphosphatase
MLMNYCPMCGEAFAKAESGKESFPQCCTGCDFRNWDSPAPVVTGLLIRRGMVVLVKSRTRGGIWGLPSGFVEKNEDAESGLQREIKEETNLNATITGWLGTFPIFNGKKWILLIAYEAATDEDTEFTPSEEIAEIRDFDPSSALEVLRGEEERRIVVRWIERNRKELK